MLLDKVAAMDLAVSDLRDSGQVTEVLRLVLKFKLVPARETFELHRNTLVNLSRMRR